MFDDGNIDPLDDDHGVGDMDDYEDIIIMDSKESYVDIDSKETDIPFDFDEPSVVGANGIQNIADNSDNISEGRKEKEGKKKAGKDDKIPGPKGEKNNNENKMMGQDNNAPKEGFLRRVKHFIGRIIKEAFFYVGNVLGGTVKSFLFGNADAFNVRDSLDALEKKEAVTQVANAPAPAQDDDIHAANKKNVHSENEQEESKKESELASKLSKYKTNEHKSLDFSDEDGKKKTDVRKVVCHVDNIEHFRAKTGIKMVKIELNDGENKKWLFIPEKKAKKHGLDNLSVNDITEMSLFMKRGKLWLDSHMGNVNIIQNSVSLDGQVTEKKPDVEPDNGDTGEDNSSGKEKQEEINKNTHPGTEQSRGEAEQGQPEPDTEPELQHIQQKEDITSLYTDNAQENFVGSEEKHELHEYIRDEDDRDIGDVDKATKSKRTSFLGTVHNVSDKGDSISFSLTDTTGSIECICHRRNYEALKGIIQNDVSLRVYGKVEKHFDEDIGKTLRINVSCIEEPVLFRESEYENEQDFDMAAGVMDAFCKNIEALAVNEDILVSADNLENMIFNGGDSPEHDNINEADLSGNDEPSI